MYCFWLLFWLLLLPLWGLLLTRLLALKELTGLEELTILVDVVDLLGVVALLVAHGRWTEVSYLIRCTE